jgi:hypothetical protein
MQRAAPGATRALRGKTIFFLTLRELRAPCRTRIIR